jgi:hypothetical protein
LGLYDYGARWYDPAIGRWTSVDPLAETMASWSPYNYVLGDPISLTDPTGMFPENWNSDSEAKKPFDVSNRPDLWSNYISSNGGGQQDPGQGDPIYDGGTLPTATVTASRPNAAWQALGENRFSGWEPMGCGCGLSYSGQARYDEWNDQLMQSVTDMLNIAIFPAGGGVSSRSLLSVKIKSTRHLMIGKSMLNYTDEISRVVTSRSTGGLARPGMKSIPNGGFLPNSMRSTQIGGGLPTLQNLRLSPYNGLRPSPSIQYNFTVGPIPGSSFTGVSALAFFYARHLQSQPK